MTRSLSGFKRSRLKLIFGARIYMNFFSHFVKTARFPRDLVHRKRDLKFSLLNLLCMKYCLNFMWSVNLSKIYALNRIRTLLHHSLRGGSFAIAFNNESHELAHIYQLNITYSFYTQWLQSLHMKWMSRVGENLKYKSKYFLWTKVKDRLVHFLCRPQSVYKTVASKVMICLVKSSRNVTNSYIIAHLCIYTH